MFKPSRHVLELGAALLLYAGLLLASNLADRVFLPTGAAKLILAVTPMVGAVAAAWTILRGVRRMDELQRRVQFEAIALAFAGTALITFGWGFAESAGAPTLRAFAVWPIMASLWAAGLFIANRRYQ
ncbi:hypothetical protein [Oleisolibacter albus]|uniref:hypothetical protein n=1 Tax=Oleisolibacter albus TaxID=2171757 RepID=UPI000DF2AC5D|nr:hypothetical protein [Oleisolibacter albus]